MQYIFFYLAKFEIVKILVKFRMISRIGVYNMQKINN